MPSHDRIHQCEDVFSPELFIGFYIYSSFLLGLFCREPIVSIMSLFMSFIAVLIEGILYGAITRQSITDEKSKFTTMYLTELKVNGRTYVHKTRLFEYPTSIGEYLYNKYKKINDFKLYVLDNINTYFEKHKDD